MPKTSISPSGRRSFVKNLGILGVSLFFLSKPIRPFHSQKKLTVLVLGGTNFLGPAIVHTFLHDGHEVSLFNRGITNPKLFTNLPRYKGDRTSGIEGYNSLSQTKKTWDLIIDVWPENPLYVEEAVKVLQQKTDHYVFVSSIAVYRNYTNIGMDENATLLTANGYEEGNYSGNKVICENLVRSYFPGRYTIVRPGAIVGDRDPGPFGTHLLKSLMQYDEVLAPDSNDPVQFIDSKDIGKFLVKSGEKEIYGEFNLVGPEQPMGYKDLVIGAKKALKSTTEIVWVDPDFLINNMDVEPFSEIPFWIPVKDDPEPGFYQISNRKALENGLTYTSYSETVETCYNSFKERRHIPEPGSEDYFGIKRQKEISVIKAWKERG